MKFSRKINHLTRVIESRPSSRHDVIVYPSFSTLPFLSFFVHGFWLSMKRRTNYLKVLKPFAFILPNECLSGLHGEQKKKKKKIIDCLAEYLLRAFSHLHIWTECWNVGSRQFFIILFLFFFPLQHLFTPRHPFLIPWKEENWKHKFTEVIIR